MNRRVLHVIALFALIASSPLHAAEAPQASAVQQQLFGRPLGRDKAHACFRRVYDSPHLDRHPQQNVRSMMMLVTGDPGDARAGTDINYQLVMDVSFRREGHHFETVGNCRSLFPPPARCGIDCDGGSLEVSMKTPNTMMVGIPERARIWRAGTDLDDDTGPYRKRFGPDDKLFRLERAPPQACLALVSDPAEKTALQRGQ